MSGPETISPTAHYTGYVWARNGLSHPGLETVEGRVLFESLRPVMTANALLGRGTLESYLLARHRAIDSLLQRAIERGGVRQVIEVAAGLSPRGWRFVQRHPELIYVDADLPGMTARKRRALASIESDPERHLVRELDVLRPDGPGSLAAVAGELDEREGLAIITEGLLPYLPSDQVRAMWRRFATTLSRCSSGVYISDLHVGDAEGVPEQAFRVLLSLFVRGRVTVHFDSTDEVLAASAAAGFACAEVRPAIEVAGGERRDRTTRLAHILEASTR
jgi:O-methyltransferase involved in polyketide biosynthesis